MREKPLMGTITQEHDVVRVGAIQLAPASRDKGPGACDSNGFENHARHALRIIQHDAAKAYIHGWWPGLQELVKLWGWRVVRRLAKEEAAYICRLLAQSWRWNSKKPDGERAYIGAPVCRLWHKRWRPAVRNRCFELFN